MRTGEAAGSCTRCASAARAPTVRIRHLRGTPETIDNEKRVASVYESGTGEGSLSQDALLGNAKGAPRLATQRKEVNGAHSFSQAAQRVVDYLNHHTPLTDWSVSRITDGYQVHLHVHHDHLINVGDRMDWGETFCRRMAAGAAHVVPDAKTHPQYADLQVARKIGAYAGYTIGDDNGQPFGVLCGVRSQPLEADESVDEELLKVFSDLLSSQLELSRGFDRDRRALEIAKAQAHRDALTDLLNRRGWDAILADAQARVNAFGDLVAVAVLDIDGLKALNDSQGHTAGDQLIQRAARALRDASSRSHRIARYGGDEFVILANGIPSARLEQHFAVFRQALETAGVAASLGYAASVPGDCSVQQAFMEADRQMYLDKQRRRAR